MLIGSLCTGYGGLDLAVRRVFGADLAWWSDIDPGAVAVMTRHVPHVPNLGDIRSVDWAAVPPVDILTAGYPCTPFSIAGFRRGPDDPRHLWPHVAAAIGALRPRILVLENVTGHIRRGFDVVTADLAGLRYDVAWAVVRASDVGAPHKRSRLFVVAQDSDRATRHQWRESAPGQAQSRRARADVSRRGGTPVTDVQVARWGDYAPAIARWERITGCAAPDATLISARAAEVLSPRFVEWMMGLPAGYVTGTAGMARNHMLKVLGNGVVPQQAAYAIERLWAQLQTALPAASHEPMTA